MPEIEWTPVFASAGMDAMITAFSTYVATHPKYTKLVNTIKNRLGAGDDFKQKLLIYLKEKTGNQLAEKAGKFTKYSNLVNRLDKLEKIVPGSKAKFFEDFESATEDVIKKIGDNPDLVDGWKTIKYSGDDNLAKLATNLDELDLVAKNLDEIAASGGYNSWKKLLISFKSVDEIRHLLKTEKSAAFFWSGRTSKGIGVQQDAMRIAESNGGTTLEMLFEKRNIKLPDWDASNPEVVKIWEDVSAEYAKQVSGEVKVVLGKQLREGNVWQTKELPALKSNPDVKKIITVDPETLVETVILTRS